MPVDNITEVISNIKCPTGYTLSMDEIADGLFLKRVGNEIVGVAGGGGGAPTDAEYITYAANAGLSAEKVLGTDIIMLGTAAAQPAATAVPSGAVYYITDAGQQRWQRSNGTAWADTVIHWDQVLGKPATFAPSTHAASHQNGGGDEISVAGLSGALADPQTPSAHALGGAAHSADTLANLNTKISDLIATYGAVRDIGIGTAAQRPAAAVANRFWFATDTLVLSRDNGAAWEIVVATPAAHKATHENAGADEISVAGLSGALADAQTPTAHAASHQNAGADEISVAGLSGELADNQPPKAHVLDSATHTISGKTAGQFLRPTSATAFAFEAVPISRGGVIYMSAGIPNAALNIIAWRAPFACTVTAVKGYRVGGTGATVNARRNGASSHLASALSLVSADAWADGGAVQDAAYAAGDKLEIMVVTTAGVVTQLAIQVDYTRP